MSRKEPLTNRDIAEIINMRKNGVPNVRIAEKYDVSRQYIFQICKDNDVTTAAPRRRVSVYPNIDQWIIENNTTAGELADNIGKARINFYNVLKGKAKMTFNMAHSISEFTGLTLEEVNYSTVPNQSGNEDDFISLRFPKIKQSLIEHNMTIKGLCKITDLDYNTVYKFLCYGKKPVRKFSEREKRIASVLELTPEEAFFLPTENPLGANNFKPANPFSAKSFPEIEKALKLKGITVEALASLVNLDPYTLYGFLNGQDEPLTEYTKMHEEIAEYLGMSPKKAFKLKKG